MNNFIDYLIELSSLEEKTKEKKELFVKNLQTKLYDD
jgi:hypothetical protein